MNTQRRVVLGVGGGIAAYKACLLLRLFTEAGHDVRVIPTDAALRFVSAPTWEALSGHPATASVFEDVPGVAHVRLGRDAELVVVAPATADLLAKAAHGLADDLLTNTLLTARCPVLLAPAMHTEMWLHPATQANVATLRARGLHVPDPADGRLTGADTGPGRLAEPQQIYDAALALLAAPPVGGQPDGSLAGVRIVVTAGGTREPLDPVRFLGNSSSGRQGYAIAAAAARHGAQVTLISANASRLHGGSLPDPPGVRMRHVSTTEQLREATLAEAAQARVVVMAAAVADYRPAQVAEHKIKKTGTGDRMVLQLETTPDILRELAGPARLPGQFVVGFAAETGDEHAGVEEHGRAKLARKGCDMLVVNDVSAGKVFGRPDNAVTILHADGTSRQVPQAAKEDIAVVICAEIARRLS
ncbi:MAG: bifunctional phosphopantothenoylcysteine decarboxylase/phosphopantothenate--cysteine ligase CoaBC [Micrococcales bacterium]|nr:MAG: bifunctional phosphopantothenoylcysteine decarboxylase/phosphopantothenate--cysteine ligase CoaBC [Micrococcales bacterium]